MSQNKTIETLVEDIYKLMETKSSPRGTDVEGILDDFGTRMANLLKKEFLPYVDNAQGRSGLRLSSVGKPDRQQWYSVRGYSREKLQPHNYIKFMYGHILEELLIAFTKLAGHEVSDEQKECYVEGIKGHMDCRIDGTLVDIKSASTYAFKKFENGSLAFDDPFGYVAQLKAYAHSEGDTEYAWFAIDKQNGKLAVLKYDEKDMNSEVFKVLDYDIAERVKQVKESVASQELPERCHDPVPDGKSGNEKLSTGCSYCGYKNHCYPDLRTFLYSTGPRFLTKVVKEPNVLEVTGGK